MYVDTETGEILNLEDVKNKAPGTSFSDKISKETLTRLKVSTCTLGTVPEITKYQVLTRDEKAKKDTSGKWVLGWSVKDLFSDIKDEDGKVTKTKAEQEKEYDEKIEKAKAESLRAERNKRLEETDSYAVTDRTLSDEMKEYRQKLRDLPSDLSSKWPDLEESDWPEKPNK